MVYRFLIDFSKNLNFLIFLAHLKVSNWELNLTSSPKTRQLEPRREQMEGYPIITRFV
jgi:hypothetical protein